MDIDAYLARLGMRDRPRPTVAALADLQLAHLMSVPFENLDIVAGQPLSLALDDLADKVVTRRRGGFCYELNGLFASLLAALGYRVTLLSARTVRADGGEGPEFDHLALRVDLAEPWLADVGFGDSFRLPMPLRPGMAGPDVQGRTYHLAVDGDRWTVARTDDEGAGRTAQYRFALRPRALADFVPMCRWQETESPYFTGHRVCTMATADGRRTLFDDRLIERVGTVRTERRVDEREVPEVLRALFGIVV